MLIFPDILQSQVKKLILYICTIIIDTIIICTRLVIELQSTYRIFRKSQNLKRDQISLARLVSYKTAKYTMNIFHLVT